MISNLMKKNLDDLMVSLVKFTSRELEEFSAVRVKTIRNVEANFGYVNVAGKKHVGKKARKIYQKFVMTVGMMCEN